MDIVPFVIAFSNAYVNIYIYIRKSFIYVSIFISLFAYVVYVLIYIQRCTYIYDHISIYITYIYEFRSCLLQTLEASAGPQSFTVLMSKR